MIFNKNLKFNKFTISLYLIMLKLSCLIHVIIVSFATINPDSFSLFTLGYHSTLRSPTSFCLILFISHVLYYSFLEFV